MYYLYSRDNWRNDGPAVGRFDSEQSAWNKAREIIKATPHLQNSYLSMECLARSSFTVAHDPNYAGVVAKATEQKGAVQS